MAVRFSLSRICRRCGFHAVPGAVHPPTTRHGVPLCYLSSPSAALSPEPSNTPSDPSVRQQWRVVAAACVQRMPALSRVKTELELKHEEMSNQVRLERSKLSDYELEEREFESMKKARIKKAQEEGTVVKGLSDETDEFEDIQESREIELREFEPASRLTEADQSGDMRSLNRQLSRVLYLLVKKPREEHAWQMPQGGVEGEESLIEAAKREFSEECGSSVQVNFYSNTPLAVFSYRHPPLPASHDQHVPSGSKVFFMKAFYQSGSLQLDGKELVDYAWVTKEEMKDCVSQEYYHAVEQILTD